MESLADNLTRLTTKLTSLKRQESLVKEGVTEVKTSLTELVKEFGTADDKGHIVLDLPESIDGVVRLVLQRRVSRTLSETAAEEILQGIPMQDEDGDEATLWDYCIDLVPVLDEDKVMSYLYEGLLTEEQIDEMYPISESFAFTLAKK